MAFPVSPTNGQQSTIANIVYQYTTSTNSWTVIPGYANVISATGNISGSYFIGNGSQLTGVVATGVTGLSYGNTNLGIPTSAGNANVSIRGVSNVVVWATTGEYVTGIVSATGNITSSANISGGYLLGNAYYVTGLSPTKIYNGTTEINIGTSGGNANISVGGTSNVAVVTTLGLTVSGALQISGNITSTGANGVANIGGVGAYFNTVHAKATSAQYADVAELYLADQYYAPGTVVEFGGSKEITVTTSNSSPQIAGIVSTKPSFIMNSGLEGEYVTELALLGRVPCKVVGKISKGDRLVSSNIPGVAEKLRMEHYQPGVVIGKALESWDAGDVGIIEVVVGRL